MPRAADVRLALVLLLFGAAVATVSAHPDEMNNFFTSVKECHQEFPSVTNDTIHYAIVHDLNLQNPSDEEARCWLECVLKKRKFLQDDGSLDVDMAMENSVVDFEQHLKQHGKTLDLSKVRQLLQQCASQEGSGKCEKSYNIIKCTFTDIGKMVH